MKDKSWKTKVENQVEKTSSFFFVKWKFLEQNIAISVSRKTSGASNIMQRWKTKVKKQKLKDKSWKTKKQKQKLKNKSWKKVEKQVFFLLN